MVGETGLEPVWLAPRHFKCLVYPNSTTRPSSYTKKLEAGVGIEPASTALQVEKAPNAVNSLQHDS